MSPRPAAVRCVAFDAVGTLIAARPGVAEVYHRIGQRYGGLLSVSEIAARFHRELFARTPHDETSEAAEREFWRQTVSRVLGTVRDADACFADLYAHFARADSWSLLPDVEETLQGLAAHGVPVLIASNFDGRLHTVMEGIPVLQPIARRVISSEVGWRKPSGKFYDALIAAAGAAPEEILMVGDDLERDILPARQRGLRTLHLSRKNRSQPVRLRDVWNLCGIDE